MALPDPDSSRVVRCVLADSSPVRGQILERMIQAHPQIEVVSRPRSMQQLRATLADTTIDTFLVDWDLINEMGRAFFEGLPASFSRRILVLVPRDLAESGPLDALAGSDFIGRPSSPFELESMGMQLTSSLIAAFVVRHGILPGEKVAPARVSRPAEIPSLARVAVVVIGEQGEEVLESLIPRMREDRSRGYLVHMRLAPRKQREIVGRWLMDHGLTALLATAGRKFQLGRVHIPVGDAPLMVDRTDGGKGLSFVDGGVAVAVTGDETTALDVLLASFARHLGAHLSCVVAGERTPEEFARGLYLVRRFGGSIYAPAPTDERAPAGFLVNRKLIDVTFRRDQVHLLFEPG